MTDNKLPDGKAVQDLAADLAALREDFLKALRLCARARADAGRHRRRDGWSAQSMTHVTNWRMKWPAPEINSKVISAP